MDLDIISITEHYVELFVLCGINVLFNRCRFLTLFNVHLNSVVLVLLKCYFISKVPGLLAFGRYLFVLHSK